MRLIVVAVCLLFSHEVLGQSSDPIKPIEPVPGSKTTLAPPDLNLGDWKKGMGPVPEKPGVTIYFDYTKFFEWLLPKKHPTIPPECDPNIFLQDTITQEPPKKDTILKQPPV